jgi:hypothetical protein
MHTLLVTTLSRPVVREFAARTMTTLPGSHRIVRLMHPPAERAFAAFVEVLMRSEPSDPTACAGWTVHELTAHLAAGSAEIADLIELELAGLPSRPTTPFEDREPPYRALDPTQLRRRYVEESLRTTVAIERLRHAGPSARVWFTGAALDAQTLILHAESELVLHRRDIAGDDDTSVGLLSDPRLALHAAKTVAAMTPNVFATSSNGAAVVLRSTGTPDVVMRANGGHAVRAPDDGHELPLVRCHPAVRTLLLWGRQPSDRLPQPRGHLTALASVVGATSENANRPAPRHADGAFASNSGAGAPELDARREERGSARISRLRSAGWRAAPRPRRPAAGRPAPVPASTHHR